MKRKTLYVFYKYDNEMTKSDYNLLKDNGATQHDIYPVYACTMDKTLADTFWLTRRHDKFLKFVYKLDKDEALEFMNAHHASNLVNHTFTHYKEIKKNNSNLLIEISIVVTNLEITETELSTEDWVYHSPFNLELSDPFRLKNKYTQALMQLSYFDIYRLTADSTFKQFEDAMDSLPSYPDIIFDEYAMFIYNYGKLFKGKMRQKYQL